MMPGMGGKMNARQMNQMMRRLGIQVKEIPDVQEVIIHTSQKRYTFRDAEVTIMDASGSKTYQFTGSATVRDLTEAEKANLGKPGTSAVGPDSGAEAGAPAAEVPSDGADDDVAGDAGAEGGLSAAEQLAAVEVEISDDDVALVASQTGKSPKDARGALEAAKGDIAEAILQLTD